MGLDQWLVRKTHIVNEHRGGRTSQEHGHVFYTGPASVMNERISEITEEVICWRKANAIHRYFVDEVGDGDDNCEDIWVDEDSLRELLRRCKYVLQYHDDEHAEAELPTTEGFFFGGTDYDEYYYDELQRTVLLLTEELEDRPLSSWQHYLYVSSW